MQFLIIARDAADEHAVERRMQSREMHLKGIERLREEGAVLFGAAILDEEGVMRGSMLVVDFPDRQSLENYLADEPYVIGRVWERIDITACRVPDLFMEQRKRHMKDAQR
ncbi:MAG TPA: YciI family protein [Deltaproteobacteria bacterium]|nr:YciI family protein [Deltaproteobacteria bacterium]HOM29017.1 YciI family protein [Deltaproteobacteria bacterium]HPP81756.1 YciI family protein [Deltaproteobacteria bacterium]